MFMRDTINRKWFCTGTLVSERAVVTAAHCLDTTKFKSFEVVAPRAKNQPRVKGLRPASFSREFEDVANPDIGFLTLEEPIAVSNYAVLTDVGPRIDAGEELTAGAVTRTDELPEAPLHESAPMPVTSTVDLGYEHGLATPIFTIGGDSGSGLFLVEDGKLTHKLIGVARQPDPERSIRPLLADRRAVSRLVRREGRHDEVIWYHSPHGAISILSTSSRTTPRPRRSSPITRRSTKAPRRSPR